MNHLFSAATSIKSAALCNVALRLVAERSSQWRLDIEVHPATSDNRVPIRDSVREPLHIHGMLLSGLASAAAFAVLQEANRLGLELNKITVLMRSRLEDSPPRSARITAGISSIGRIIGGYRFDQTVLIDAALTKQEMDKVSMAAHTQLLCEFVPLGAAFSINIGPGKE